MSTKPADVSVIIPAHNAAGTLADTVASVFAQTVLPKEVIVVDDGSTDATAATAKALKGPVPVRYIRQQNARQAAARNNGARHAAGVWLAFLDADDRWLPGKLELQLAAAAARPEAAAVAGNFRIIDQGASRDLIPDIIPAPAWEARTLLEANFFWLSGTMVKADAFRELGGFNPTYRNAEDVEFGFRLCKRYPVTGVTDVVAEYRRQSFSSSNQEAHDISGLLRFYGEVLERGDLTPEERRLAGEKRDFWRQRERLFLVRRDAVTKGQLAGIATYFRVAFGRNLSAKSAGLLALLLIPGSIGYLKRTRWSHLDFSA